jgi:hypothetical protein
MDCFQDFAVKSNLRRFIEVLNDDIRRTVRRCMLTLVNPR